MKKDQLLKQSYQENEFCFPYHYIAQFEEEHFKHCFLDTWSINYASTMEYLLQKIVVGPNYRIVDVGCGDGRFSRELAMAFSSSSILGIDYSKRAIALASAMNPDIANLGFQCLDITQEHRLASFNIAILMEVFEHIPIENADNFLESVRSLLENDGTLYLTVPHENKLLEYKHFRHFSIEGIIHALQPYFHISEVVPFERISWQRGFLQKILSNELFILHNSSLLSLIYRWYKRNLFFCSSEGKCQRIFVKAVVK